MDTNSQEQAPQWATVLLDRINALESHTRTLQARLDTASSRRRDRLPDVPIFDGLRREYLSWVTQLRAKLNVDLENDKETTRFWYCHSRLRGKALLQVSPWVQMAITNGILDVEGLVDQLDAMYDTKEEVNDGEKQLLALQQKNRSFAIYFAEFERSLIAANGILWPDRVKRMFLESGFSKELRAALIPVEKPENFESYVAVVRRVAMDLERGRGIGQPTSSYASTMDWETAPEVRVASTGIHRAKRVSKEAIEARRAKGLCLRCGQTGHRIRDCTFLPPGEDDKPVGVNASRIRQIGPDLEDDSDEDGY